MFNRKELWTFTALAMLLTATVISCGDDDPAICIGDDLFIVPLSLETVWIYRVSDYDTANALIRTFEDTVMITGETNVDGDHWYETSIEDELWANRADGFWVWKESQSDVSEPYLMIKHPATLGEKYPIPVEDIAMDTMTVADVMALVRVPYGSFTGITYQLANYSDTTLSLAYYVRGLGKVREIMIPDRNTRKTRRIIELLKFTTDGC